MSKETDADFITVRRSSNHRKIAGDFGEHLALYWLSRSGFECAYVDHVGIDIIAIQNNVRLGISVKSRTREEKSRATTVKLDGFEKVEIACKTFGCKPFFAIVVDDDPRIYLYIVSLQYLRQLYPRGHRLINWGMSNKWTDRYAQDPNIRAVTFEFSASRAPALEMKM